LLRVTANNGKVELSMAGEKLAARAIATMANGIRLIIAAHGLQLDQLDAVVAHGGNGRMPRLLARELGLPAEKVQCTTAETGNLGSASLLVAWAAHTPQPGGPVVWTAVGAGLTWGVALTGDIVA
jgi:3-oxoacyl-[acyl-carrier-protein] synthase III